MSTDLREAELQRERNALIAKELQPCLVLTAGTGDGASKDAQTAAATAEAPGVEIVSVEALSTGAATRGGDDSGTALDMADGAAAGAGAATAAAPPPLCFVFTGGTTRARCVAVTHAMVLHEHTRYTECLPLRPPVRVLAHTSNYWGASALGQLSIALAYGGCAILSEAVEVDELHTAITSESVSVLGLVPDQLRMLAEDPASELPGVRAVFTWGERLPRAVAERWRGHPCARLRELLISTEYWLSFYAAPLEDSSGLLRIVGGVRALVLAEGERPAGQGEVGELLLEGGMVTSGYVAGGDRTAFRDVGGTRYFCTRDLVRVARDGLFEFRGRADMSTKERGKWVDLLSLEEALRAIAGVAAAAIVPDPRGGSEPHAFVVLGDGAPSCPATTLAVATAALPRGAQLHVLDHLPRHPVTRKVDLKRLAAQASPADRCTWPLELDAPAPDHVAARAKDKVKAHCLWTLVAAAAAAAWDLRTLAAWFSAGHRSGRQGGLWQLLQLGHGFVLLPFMHLAFIHTADSDHWRWLDAIWAELPLGFWGGALLALAGRGAASRGSVSRRLCGASVVALASLGASWALHRRRLLSYPLLFWAGIGHRLDYDCQRWLRWAMWRDHFWWQLSRLVPAPSPSKAIAEPAAASAPPPPKPTPGDTPPVAAAVAGADVGAGAANAPAAELADATVAAAGSPLSCKWCGRGVRVEWPPPELASPAACPEGGPARGANDGAGDVVCWQCWPQATEVALREGAELVRELASPGAQAGAEPEAEPAEQEAPASARRADGVASSESPPAAGLGTGAADNAACNGGRVVAAVSAAPKSLVAAEAGGDGGGKAACNGSAGVVGVGPALESPPAAHRELAQESTWSVAAVSRTDVEPSSPEEQAAGKTDPEKRKWSDEEAKNWRRRYDRWWWYQKTQDVIDVLPCQTASLRLPPVPVAPSADEPPKNEPEDPRLRRVCRCLEKVVGTAGAGMATPLHGLDSFQVSLLTTRVRAEFGARTLSVTAVRRAATVAELLEAAEAAVVVTERTAAAAPAEAVRVEKRQEYALWFSPGQHVPMGGWVLRTEAPVDAPRLAEAARRLVDRHVALRARPCDPLRLLSFCLDTGVLFTLVARLLDRGPWPARKLRALVSWALRDSWARVAAVPRTEMYAAHEEKAPFAVLRARDQPSLEALVKRRRNILGQRYEPVDIALVVLEASIAGLWVFGYRGGTGEFAVLPPAPALPGEAGEAAAPAPAKAPSGTGFIFVDRRHRQAGELVGPSDPRWLPPPYGFPALLCARLAPSGDVIWLRLSKPREISVIWKPHGAERWWRFVAFQMPGAPPAPGAFSFLVVHAMHSMADGMSFESIVGDLVALYAQLGDSSGSGSASLPLPPLMGDGLAELQRRLFRALDAADTAACPQLCSLRGGIWRLRGRGYGHLIGLQRGAVTALRRAAAAYGAPLDTLLLALAVIAIARAGGLDSVPLTLYVPLRDGPGEVGLVGLFADWRNIAVRTDADTATVVGVVLEVAHILRSRRWGLFNALRKQEAMMVNFQPLDAASPESRGGFKQIGEELWRIGESFAPETRTDDMGWVPQPLSLTLEEGDKENWWVMVSFAWDTHPPPWARRWIQGFQDAFWALLVNPSQKVHVEYPEDFY